MTAKQARFVTEYLVDLNGTQAAIRAGYSPKTANEQAAQLLAKLSIQEAVAEGRKKQAEDAGIRAKDILDHTRHIAFSDPRRLYDAKGLMLALKDWPDDVAAAFMPLEITKRNLTAGDGVQEDVVKVRAWDKMKALEKLGQHLGLWEENVNHRGEIVLTWKTSE